MLLFYLCKQQIVIMYLWKQIKSAPLVLVTHFLNVLYVKAWFVFFMPFPFQVNCAVSGPVWYNLSIILLFPLAFIFATRTWLIHCLTGTVIIDGFNLILISCWHLISFRSRQITTLLNPMCARPCRTKRTDHLNFISYISVWAYHSFLLSSLNCFHKIGYYFLIWCTSLKLITALMHNYMWWCYCRYCLYLSYKLHHLFCFKNNIYEYYLKCTRFFS